MKAKEFIEEEMLDEMPLPADWDTSQFNDKTSYKARLAYALDRAKKLGTGSSRVAMIIEYEGRPTVLKIAKNPKGLAQNEAEAAILDDGYTRQLNIAIPLIDYDMQHSKPIWIHTELAQKVTSKQLCNLLKVKDLYEIVQLSQAISGQSRFMKYQTLVDWWRKSGRAEQDIEVATDYANTLVDLANSFNVELGDFGRAANWGLYKGHPVVIDVGFTSDVKAQHYS